MLAVTALEGFPSGVAAAAAAWPDAITRQIKHTAHKLNCLLAMTISFWIKAGECRGFEL
jgi:hypothetical protein